MNYRRMLMPTLVLAVGLTACTAGTKKSAQSPASPVKATAPAPASGLARLEIDGQVLPLSLQLCVRTGASGINVTAVGPSTPASKLTVNLVDPVKASTMVFTTIKPDNSYTIFSMGSGAAATTGTLNGERVTMSGMSSEQAYDAAGQIVGTPKPTTISLDATCRTVQPQQPAPSFAPSGVSAKPTTRKSATAPQPSH